MTYLKHFVLLIIMLSTPAINAYQRIYKHQLAVCAIFKNEAPYLKEWLEFYKLIGVQHFYLYNNNSTDNYKEILQPYIESKEVDLIDWDYPYALGQAQNSAYNNCLRKARGKVKWLGFLDLDEFLFPVQENNLQTFLKQYESYGAVCANWVMFGTSDIEIIPDNTLTIEALTTRAFLDEGVHKHVKSIVRPERVVSMSAHNPTKLYRNFFQVTTDKIKFTGPYSPTVALDKLRINHYWTRDKKWLTTVKMAHRYDYDKRGPAWVLEQASVMDKEQDYTIQKFVTWLKQNMCM